MGAVSSLNLPRPFGPYELVRQLAVGGMAEVFMARARSVAGFEKIVALKTIHPRFSEDPEFSRLLVEEANITAQLSHRNIVQVIDLGQIDGTHYIAMEYVDGVDLSRLLQKLRERQQVASPRVAAFVVREVCDGLEHAHRKVDADGKPLKIIHRDVSPPNILLSFAGEVKLTDFGIAKAALRASATEAGVVKGKYAYMAPEQARGQPVDHRVDVFAAGCVLYELATGVPVYKEAPLPVLLERVSRGVFEPPERVKPDLPSALVAIIHRALAARPDDRYPSARAMADDLNSFLFTLPPNPELELIQLLDDLFGSGRSSLPPMAGVSLFDDDSEEATQIESMAVVRQKMAMPTLPPPPSTSTATASEQRTNNFRDEPTRALRPRDLGGNVGDVTKHPEEPEPTVAYRPSTATPRVRKPTPPPGSAPVVPMSRAPSASAPVARAKSTGADPAHPPTPPVPPKPVVTSSPTAPPATAPSSSRQTSATGLPVAPAVRARTTSSGLPIAPVPASSVSSTPSSTVADASQRVRAVVAPPSAPMPESPVAIPHATVPNVNAQEPPVAATAFNPFEEMPPMSVASPSPLVPVQPSAPVVGSVVPSDRSVSDDALRLAERRQKLAVVFAGVFAALGVLALITVLLIGR